MGTNDNGRRKNTEAKRPRGSAVNAQQGSSQSRRTSATTKSRKKNKDGKSHYIAFYILTLIVAVAVCLGTFWFVFSQISPGRVIGGEGTTGTTPDTTQTAPDTDEDDPDTEPPIIAIDEVGLTGVIVSVNQSAQTFEILDIDSLSVLSFSIDNSTTMQNRTGGSMNFAQFRPGEIIDARYRELSEPLTSIALAPNAWEHRNIGDVRVNPQGNTITVGDGAVIYRYHEQTISLFNDAPFDIADIHPLDTATIRGVGSDIWFIELNRGTGFINIVNGENIRNGVIEISGHPTVFLNEDGTTDAPIRVQVGTKQIFVQGDNIHDFNTALDVSTNEQAILDLSAVQVLSGVISFNISQPDAIITINGNVHRADEPLILDHGRYNLSVSLEGFITYERTFEFNAPSMDITVNLERDVTMVNISVFTSDAVTGEPLMGARIYLNNEFLGVTPFTALVAEGNHMLSIRKDGFANLSFVTDGRPRYDVELQASGPTMPPALP